MQVFLAPVQSDKIAGCKVRYGGDWSPLWAWFDEDHAYLEHPLGVSLEVRLEGCPHFLAFLKENKCSKYFSCKIDSYSTRIV